VKRILVGIVILMSLISSGEAQERGVQVRPADKELFETEPRQIVTTVFRVTNTASERREFTAELRLPQGWNPITRDFDFELDAHETETRLVSFLAPQTTFAGEYEVTYLVKARWYPSVADFYTIHVVVLPVTRLAVKIRETPEYVIAGEQYRASYIIINQSNVAGEVHVTVENGANLPCGIDNKTLSLGPGESGTVTVRIQTDEALRKVLTLPIQVTAHLGEDATAQAQLKHLVGVIPRITGGTDPFHYIPMEMTFRQIAEKNGDGKAGFQGVISGEGTLDEVGEKHIALHLQGPDTLEESRFGERDEYWLSFWTDQVALHLGDRVYSLSPLTERYLYGRGGEVTARLNDLQLGGYYLRTRWLDPQEEQRAAFIDYTIRDKHSIGVNYLEKRINDGDSKIISVHGNLQPIQNTDVELEYAYGRNSAGEEDDAYLLRVAGTQFNSSYQLRFIRAGPDYPGYYSDTDLLSTGVSLPIRKGLKLNGTYWHEKQNLDLDPALSDAPLEQYYKLGLQYTLKTKTNLFFDYTNRDREDRLPDPSFDFHEDTIKLGVGHSFNKWSIHGSGEFGRIYDNIRDQTSDLTRYSASAYFRPTANQRHSGYVYYDTHGDFTGEKNRRVTTGINSYFNIGSRLSLDLNADTSRYLDLDGENEHNIRLRSTYLLRSKSKIFDKNRISLSGWYTGYGGADREDEIAFMLEYTIPFKIPIRRKKGIGTLKGHVYDQQSMGAVPDVIVRVNEATAVTDKEGNFTFPSLPPGVHYLRVDTGKVGHNLVPVQKNPMKVSIQGGKDESIELALVESAEVSGQIVVYRFERNAESANGQTAKNREEHFADKDPGVDYPDSGNTEMVSAYGLANTLVELTDGTETKRRVTDNKGRFEFEELPPGQWVVKIVEGNLPEYHYIEQDTFQFEMSPGEHKEILARILPKRRPIHIIQEGGVISLEN
jgi:hypothetical protein